MGGDTVHQHALQELLSFLSPNEGLCFRCSHRVDHTLVSSRKPVFCLLQTSFFFFFTRTSRARCSEALKMGKIWPHGV